MSCKSFVWNEPQPHCGANFLCKILDCCISQVSCKPKWRGIITKFPSWIRESAVSPHWSPVTSYRPRAYLVLSYCCLFVAHEGSFEWKMSLASRHKYCPSRYQGFIYIYIKYAYLVLTWTLRSKGKGDAFVRHCSGAAFNFLTVKKLKGLIFTLFLFCMNHSKGH